jgi:hypothetical protein
LAVWKTEAPQFCREQILDIVVPCHDVLDGFGAIGIVEGLAFEDGLHTGQALLGINVEGFLTVFLRENHLLNVMDSILAVFLRWCR